ncbi:MAG TPA: Tex-like N-terminal domain-containing protein [Planctomycetota bacterium]|nr:Tex-like N-terminal domain-containing protein [Planctomycetota bacterium]
MTSPKIVAHVAREFAARPEHIHAALEMLDFGMLAPFIARVRREPCGVMSESFIRRIAHRRTELEELDRRRATILRMVEASATATPADIERVQNCMDRFELEDLFVPHRRPELEVQHALDRGLGKLADLLVEPLPRSPKVEAEDAALDEKLSEEAASEPEPAAQPEEHAESVASEENASGEESAATSAEEESQASDANESAPPASNEPGATWEGRPEKVDEEGAALPEATHAHETVPLTDHVELTPALARACAPFVNPDKGIHTEAEALAGAMRILSDRLGRDARLRGLVRRLLRKHGILSVRSSGHEGKAGRHKPLLKLRQPVRQIQGHRLLAVRQAQKERAVTTVITLDVKQVLPKVRAVLGRHTHPDFANVLDTLARQALERRLLPVVEADVRLELKERADDEALRFLAQHLREMLLSPPWGPYPVVGVDVGPKGDLTLCAINPQGEPLSKQNTKEDATVETVRGVRIEVEGKDDAALAAEITTALAALGEPEMRMFAFGHGKPNRTALSKFRAALRAGARNDSFAFIVNDSGLSSYANSELGRSELPDHAVPQRMAISLGRRLQDPLAEFLKVDPRHLGVGSEQGLVSKANVRRVFNDAIQSAIALVGCDVNRASVGFLEHLPGLDREAAKRLVARRAERPFESREELRQDGLLSEVQWTNAIAFLRVQGSPEPLDSTGLHPEQYELARRVIMASGASVEEALNHPGSTKGMRRGDFGVDDLTWRDLMREIAFPGRDARMRLFVPQLLDPATDPATLTPGRTLEGSVTNVASFGAFVDLGLAADAMIHISEISDRYVRDARELLSVGRTVRVRIVDPSGPRMAVSLKNVAEIPREPRRERPPRPPRNDDGRAGGEGERSGGGDRGGQRGGRGEWREREPRRPEAPVRAAVSRRDGLAGAGGGRKDRFGGGRGGKPGGGRDREGGRDDSYDPQAVKAASKAVENRPLAGLKSLIKVPPPPSE